MHISALHSFGVGASLCVCVCVCACTGVRGRARAQACVRARVLALLRVEMLAMVSSSYVLFKFDPPESSTAADRCRKEVRRIKEKEQEVAGRQQTTRPRRNRRLRYARYHILSVFFCNTDFLW